jgi:hypothetical protein
MGDIPATQLDESVVGSLCGRSDSIRRMGGVKSSNYKRSLASLRGKDYSEREMQFENASVPLIGLLPEPPGRIIRRPNVNPGIGQAPLIRLRRQSGSVQSFGKVFGDRCP